MTSIFCIFIVTMSIIKFQGRILVILVTIIMGWNKKKVVSECYLCMKNLEHSQVKKILLNSLVNKFGSSDG